MKLSLLLALAALPLFAFAQGQPCKIVDDKGQGIPYANVYSPSFKVGTISDAQGRFTLPAVPADATLLVSCIGFEDQRLVAGSLRQGTEDCRIVLVPKTYETPQAEVSAQRVKYKSKKVGLDTRSELVQHGFGANERSTGFEIGLVMKGQPGCYVEKVGFNILTATGLPHQYEVNIYAVENGLPATPLQRERIFLAVTEERIGASIEVDVREQAIGVEGLFFVSLETIIRPESKKQYGIMMAAGLLGRKSLSKGAKGEWESDRSHPSIYAVLRCPR